MLRARQYITALVVIVTAACAEGVMTSPGPLLATPDGGFMGVQEYWSFPMDFYVQNQTGQPRTYTFTCSYAGNITGCTPPGPTVIAPGTPATQVLPTWTSGGLGSGSATLYVTEGGTGQTDEASRSGSVNPAVAVTPDGGAVSREEQLSGLTVTFNVYNRRFFAQGYNLSCARTGQVSSCSVQSTLTLGSRANQNVDVTFATGTVGSGTVKLIATENNTPATDEGIITVTATAIQQPVLTPDGGRLTAF